VTSLEAGVMISSKKRIACNGGRLGGTRELPQSDRKKGNALQEDNQNYLAVTLYESAS
jgi:hypothetical protein